MTQVFTEKVTHLFYILLTFTQRKSCFFILLTSFITSNSVHSEELEEYQAKALLVYNFIKSTSWPEGSFKTVTSPIEIGIIGDEEFYNSFENYQGKRVKNRSLKFVKLELMTDFSKQHALYISGRWNAPIHYFLRNLSSTKKPILTIGESEDFALNGGIISIIKKNNHLALLTNPNAAKNSNLFLSRNLLKLSKQVSNIRDNK